MKPGLPQWALDTFQEPVVRAYVARPRADVTTYTFHTDKGRLELFFPLSINNVVTVRVLGANGRATAFDIMDADDLVPDPDTTKEMLVHYIVFLRVFSNTPCDSSEWGAIQVVLYGLESRLHIRGSRAQEIERQWREYRESMTDDELAYMLAPVAMGIKKTRRLFK